VFQEFISAQDDLRRYEAFWRVWELFYPSIVKVCRSGSSGRRSSSVVPNYLFAWPYWRKGLKEWHSLRERDKAFLKRVADELGEHPDVLRSLAQVLNGVGASFAADGVFWISGILDRAPTLASEELEANTIDYLENFVRGYVLRYRHKVRTTPQIKERILVILNFLLEKGSVTAYLIREDVL
jgi:hypothetical protein